MEVKVSNRKNPFQSITSLELVGMLVAFVILGVVAFFYCIAAYLTLRIPVGWAEQWGHELLGEAGEVPFAAIATLISILLFVAFTLAWVSWVIGGAAEWEKPLKIKLSRLLEDKR